MITLLENQQYVYDKQIYDYYSYYIAVNVFNSIF